jgi:hypothetical protein
MMNTYVAIINGKAVLAFRADDDDEARAIVDDKEGSMRSDLEAREATAAQHAEWKQSRDQAIGDGEIDLDARNNPDEWNVYLISAPPTSKFRRKN